MVVLTTGHQVRCILLGQVAIFNKGLAFVWIKLFALNIFCEEYLQTSLCLMLQTCLNFLLSKVFPRNNFELLNIQACSFLMFWNRGCTQSLVVSCKYWVVPLIYTRVSCYSHVNLFLSPILSSTRAMTCNCIVSVPLYPQTSSMSCCWFVDKDELLSMLFCYSKQTMPLPHDAPWSRSWIHTHPHDFYVITKHTN